MKTAILYYSYSGHTKARAQARAQRDQADLIEVVDRKRPGALYAYTLGCFNALRIKGTPIAPMGAHLDDYDSIVLMAPVWAGHPAPAMLSALDALPAGKQVSVVLVSGGGSSNCKDKIEALVKGKGCTLVGFEDVKG